MIIPRFEDQIVRAVQGRNPLIYIRTPEEERVIDRLLPLAPHCFPGGSLTTWSCVRGLEPAVEGVDTRDPAAALQQIIANPRRGFFVMKDLSDFLTDPRVVRGLREAYFSFARSYQSAIVLISPSANIPESLEKELFTVELDAPSPEELTARVAEVEKQYAATELSAEERAQVVLALRGLTMTEVNHLIYRVFSAGASGSKVLDEIFAEKGILAKKAGFLEFIPLKFDTSIVGGLENVKTWAAKRKDLFNQAAVNAGMPIPKGVLVMGVSGCGKSLLAKAIAGLWQIPLFRLNMSMVFSGQYGSPETAFRRALDTIEGIAPAVLWIDEMESSLSIPKEAATSQSMIFSEFLTWMQEKPPLIFVAATANRIEMLPAEVIRKGRFDQVFFCDLPDETERAHIIRIHLERNLVDVNTIDINRLITCTSGWSGAEIEQAIIATRIDARQAGKTVTTDGIWLQTYNMVPLSKTMSEQVKAIRDWAFKRATPASIKKAV
ncbi:MAG: AAA family ATPase [Elusimicrobiota bacterium]|nr:AAA family ATPase [Elusimicrobiota bacterium]